MNETEIIEYLEEVVVVNGGAARWAEDHGISPSSVYQMLDRRRPPMPKILKALNVRKVVRYVKFDPNEETENND